MKRIIIGIDISKHKFDAAYMAVLNKWQRGTFENTPEGYKHFIKWLESVNGENCHFVMEATGRYGEDLAQNRLHISNSRKSYTNTRKMGE